MKRTWLVRPAKTQIRLHGRAVWSESSPGAFWTAKDSWFLKKTARTLIRLCVCAGWSESELSAHVKRCIFWRSVHTLCTVSSMKGGHFSGCPVISGSSLIARLFYIISCCSSCNDNSNNNNNSSNNNNNNNNNKIIIVVIIIIIILKWWWWDDNDDDDNNNDNNDKKTNWGADRAKGQRKMRILISARA